MTETGSTGPLVVPARSRATKIQEISFGGPFCDALKGARRTHRCTSDHRSVTGPFDLVLSSRPIQHTRSWHARSRRSSVRSRSLHP